MAPPAADCSPSSFPARAKSAAVQVDDSLSSRTRKKSSRTFFVAAHADARRKLEALLAERMQALTGGLPLPPGLKLF